MELVDLEWAGEQIYRWAGVDDPCTILSTVGLAQRILGATAVRRIPRLSVVAALARLGDERIIAVRAGLLPAMEQWAVGHELGHLFLEREGYKGDRLEECCNFIGAALTLRRKPFVERAADVGWEQLALDFETTQTSVVLRIGETMGRPLAVVTPAKVYARGEAQWPDEHTLRSWAKRPPSPQLKTVRLGDDRKRVVIDASEAA